MTNQQGQAAIEARLDRAAELLGDLTAPVIAEYYRRFPAARASFVHHSPHGPERLEAEMVGNTLYYVMTWFESPTEARIYFDTSVPHHRVALDVTPDWFRGLIDALIDVIESAVPAIDAAEQQAWDEMRAALVGLVERNRFV
ncbi:MAG: hypothetical protein ACKOW1_02555 [Novosphingobium sp.]